MIQNPYSVLGISENASEDEIKAAYRNLAKRYHPDVNGGSPQAEQKMKEINEAYQMLLKSKRTGEKPWQNAQGYQNPYGNSYGNPYQNSYGNPYQNAYRGYQSYQGNYQGSYQNYQGNGNYAQVRQYIRMGQYEAANRMLDGMSVHGGEWHYLKAVIESARGNRISALDHAMQAVNMEPSNMEYQAFLQQLQGDSQEYEQESTHFGSLLRGLCRNPVLAICMLNMLCTCLCNLSGNCCGGGYYGGYMPRGW